MNPYDVLGVRPSASDAEIRRAYLALAQRWHPDHAGDDEAAQAEAEERMRAVNAAWALLGDRDRRSRFDAGRPAPGFVPDHPDDDGFDPRDVADVPYRTPTRLTQRWSSLSMAPVGFFAAGVLTIGAGIWFSSAAIAGAGVVIASLGVVALVLLLLTALIGARRDEG